MADIQKTINVIFGAQDDLSPVLKGIKSDLSSFDSAVQSVADPVASFTKGLLAAEASVAALGGALVAFSINEASEFQGALHEIAALFNGTVEQSDQLSAAILAFSRDSVFAIEDINSATFTAISTGTEWANVTELLAAAQILAVGGASDLSSATELLSRSINIYGEEAGTTTEIAEALFVAAQQGDTNFTELAATLGRILQPAQAANVAFEEMLAAVAAITIGTGNTGESMTLLKALFKELASPSKELVDALGGLNLESNSLKEIMDALKVATGGQYAAMDKLFSSTEAVNGALILANDTSGKFTSALDAMEDKSGKLAAAYALMAKDIEKLNQTLVNNLRATFINVGTPLLDEFGDAVTALTSIFKTVGEEIESGALRPLEDALEDFARNASNSLAGIAEALPEALGRLDFSGLIASFERLGVVFDNVFGSIFGADLDLSKPEDLAKALQAAVNIAESLVNITAGIIKEFQPIFDALGQAGQSLSSTSSDTEAAIGKLLGAMTLLGEFGTALGALIIVLGEAKVDIENVFDTLSGAAKIMVNALQVAFDAAVGIIVTAGAAMFRALDVATPDWYQELIGIDYGAIADRFDELGFAVANNLGSNLDDATDGVKQLASGLTGVRDPAEQAELGVNKTADGIKSLTTESDKLNTLGPSEELEKLGVSASKAAAPVEKTAGAMVKLDAASKEYGSEQEKLNALIAEAEANGKQYVAGIRDGVAQITILGDAHNKVVAPIKKVEDALHDLTDSERLTSEQAHDMEITLLEVASNERIASMQFKAELDIANVEANAEIMVAIFQSTAQVIESLSEATTELWALYSDEFNSSQRSELKSAAQRMEDRLDRELDIREALAFAQVAYMNAQAEALIQGTEVHITADGLEPEIEAFMFEILKRIQTTVSGDRSAFLLGAGI